MDKLSYLPSQGTVRYTSDFNPAIGDTSKVWGCSRLHCRCHILHP
jgi:hypothetical protein